MLMNIDTSRNLIVDIKRIVNKFTRLIATGAMRKL